MGRDGTPAREISFDSLVAYGPKVSDSALAMEVTASETRQGGSQQAWMELESIMLSEISQVVKEKYHINSPNQKNEQASKI